MKLAIIRGVVVVFGSLTLIWLSIQASIAVADALVELQQRDLMASGLQWMGQVLFKSWSGAATAATVAVPLTSVVGSTMLGQLALTNRRM